MIAVFRPLGYNKPKGISKTPDYQYKRKSGKRHDGFSSSAFVLGSSIFFRCSYCMEKIVSNADGKRKPFWKVRNAWFELSGWPTSSMSEAVEMAAPYIASPHNSDMMITILNKLGRPYWPPTKCNRNSNLQLP